MMHALNDLSTQTTTGTQITADEMEHFLNYCATNPDAALLYRAIDMVLMNDSDAAYLVAPEAKSRPGGHTYFGNRPDNPKQISNGTVYALAKLIKNVMSSAAEAKVAGLFMIVEELFPMRTTLEELGHPQPATPMQTNNSTACGIANKIVKQRRSKAIDMRFYWLQDRIKQGQFHIYWAPGSINLGDYYTKHHSPAQHKRVHPIYRYTATSPSSLQGCVELLAGRNKRSDKPVHGQTGLVSQPVIKLPKTIGSLSDPINRLAKLIRSNNKAIKYLLQ
jgi:hypothetical protein